MARSSLKVTLASMFDDKGIVKAQKQIRQLSGTINNLGGAALKAGAAFAAFGAGRALVNFAGTAIEQARDLTRNLDGLNRVFEDVTPQMEEFTKQAEMFGLSQAEAAQASVFLGSVIKQSGFDMQTTAEITKELVALGTDLATVYGYDVQEALLAMTALFRGEYDPIEKFGVGMKQNEIEIEKAKLQMEGLTGAQERFLDQQIRLILLFERSADSVGAFRDQQGTLYVEQELLQAQINNMAADIGGNLVGQLGRLIQAFRPMIDELVPVLTDMFTSLIFVIRGLMENKELLISRLKAFGEIAVLIMGIVARLTEFFLDNARVVTTLIGTIVALAGVHKVIAVATNIVYAYKTATALAAGAVKLLNINLAGTVFAIKSVRAALITTGIGAILVGLGFAVDFAMQKLGAFNDSTSDQSKELANAVKEQEKYLESLDADRVEEYSRASREELKKLVQEAQFTGSALLDQAGPDAVGGAARDGVRDFYANLADEVQKQKAKLKLQELGATPELISAILGSGDQWRAVFDSVVENGVASVKALQDIFNATTTGYEAAMAEWEKNVLQPFQEFTQEAENARDAFVDFLDEFGILPSVETQLGQFERGAVNLLENIEEKLADAFDNGYLLDQSYRNLVQYARDEIAVLRDIERQRDEIIARRDAAMQLIDSVGESIRASAKITDILRNIDTETERIDVVEFARKTVMAGDELKEFSVALIKNFTEPIEDAKSKADLLVDGFRGVIDRTRAFVEDLKALRALGLDPMLFNQLVEAGVEAGSETARALVEGGSDTVNEVNSLFRELDELGQELGENTAQVMYGQGELFVDGIVAGLESQAAELEATANELAEAFTTSFEEVLIAGIERAIAAAEAALARMPQVPDMDFDFGGGAGAGDGGVGGQVDQVVDAVTEGMVRRSEALDPNLYKNVVPFGGSGFSGLEALREANKFGALARGASQPAPTTFATMGQPGRYGTVINFTTGASQSTTMNAIRKYVDTSTPAAVFTSSYNRNLAP